MEDDGAHMQDNRRNFWLGNGLLAVALVMMFFLGSLWEQLGGLAMLLWMAIAGAGMYFLMQDKGPPGGFPD